MGSKKYIVFALLVLFFQLVNAEEVLIEGDGFNLTDQQVIGEFSIQEKKLKNKIKNDPEELRKLIDALYNESAFVHEARKEGLDKDPLVKNRIESSTRRILVKEIVEEKKRSIIVPDMEPLALAYYDSHPEEFWGEESVKARHILIRFDPETKKEKKALLEGLILRVQKGEDFAALAREYSDDPGSASKGGALVRFKKGGMVKEFEQKAFKLRKKGELSDIFETQYGFHVIELEEYYPRHKIEFSRVKNTIIDKLTSEYVNDEMDAWREGIVDPKKAVVNKTEIEKFIQSVGNQ